jgi:bacterioferritin
MDPIDGMEVNPFLRDVRAISSRAHGTLKERVRRTDDAQAFDLLQTALTAEILCVWRYTMMSVSLAGLKQPRIGSECQEQANDERRHMVAIAARIRELGGTPEFSPDGLETRFGEFGNRADLGGLIEHNLAAEREVIALYARLIDHFSPTDPVTARLLSDILDEESEHATDMQDLLAIDHGPDHET